jgi:hypothetical protein
MAKIDRTSWSEEFTSLAREAISERNDCSLKAIAIATGTPYLVVKREVAVRGRRSGRGTSLDVSRSTIESLGFSIREWQQSDHEYLISRYPGIHAGLRHVTTHHPRRFAAVWRPVVGDRTLVMASRTHMLCYKSGRVHDWSINRAIRIVHIWEVVR